MVCFWMAERQKRQQKIGAADGGAANGSARGARSPGAAATAPPTYRQPRPRRAAPRSPAPRRATPRRAAGTGRAPGAAPPLRRKKYPSNNRNSNNSRQERAARQRRTGDTPHPPPPRLQGGRGRGGSFKSWRPHDRRVAPEGAAQPRGRGGPAAPGAAAEEQEEEEEEGGGGGGGGCCGGGKFGAEGARERGERRTAQRREGGRGPARPLSVFPPRCHNRIQGGLGDFVWVFFCWGLVFFVGVWGFFLFWVFFFVLLLGFLGFFSEITPPLRRPFGARGAGLGAEPGFCERG